MANTTSHGNLSLGTENIHAFIRWIHEDATERASETVTADDLGKVSWQKDTDSFYCLIGTTPTWKNIGSGGAVLGNGTVGRLPKWSDVDTLGDSILSESGDIITLNGSGSNTGFKLDCNGSSCTIAWRPLDDWLYLEKRIKTDNDLLVGGGIDVVNKSYFSKEVGLSLQSYTGIIGTTTIDWTNGNKAKFTFGAGNETLVFTNPSKPCNLMLILVQDSVGGRTATFPSGIKWFNKTEPTLSTDANAEDILALFYDGTSYYASLGLNFGVTA